MKPVDAPRCYRASEICKQLQMSATTFKALLKAGKLPMCEELQPRLGKVRRYRADLVDRFFQNRLQETR